MNTKQLFENLLAKQDLSSENMEEALLACMTGAFTDVQIGAFLALMRMKGETLAELTAAAKIMQQLAHTVDLGPDLVDIVGTGGDGKNTFNVSTASSFVVAGLGIPVAKHGNRSVSSSSGSADLLEKAGFILQLNEEQLKTCIEECNLAFLFAPHYHPAMQQVKSARQQLGIRTFFNLLGPLINPAQVKKQVVGVFSSVWLKPLAELLANLGSERALVLNSQDGLDEISIAAPTRILEYSQGQFKEWQLDPKDYNLHQNSLEDVIVDSPEQSLILIQQVLEGQVGGARNMVLLNAAAAIYCAKNEVSFADALDLAKESIDSGKAASCFETLRLLTQNSRAAL